MDPVHRNWRARPVDPDRDIPIGEAPGPTKPARRRFDFEDEDVMRRRFPKLVAKFPDMGD